MKNRKHSTGVIYHTAGADIVSGEVVDLTNLVGVALDAIANGDVGLLATEDIFELAKDDSIAMTAGDALFWDSSNKECDKTEADQTFAGVCAKDAAQAATTVWVDINKGSRKVVPS